MTTVLGESTTITDASLNPSTAESPNYITADSKGPEIILNGDSHVTVYVRDNFTDTVPNYHATVTDLDGNYNSNVTSNADDFNFSVTGTYTIVYSANADSLGNIAPNVTRTVTVNLDPIGIISLNITSSSGDNFANASKNITVSLLILTAMILATLVEHFLGDRLQIQLVAEMLHSQSPSYLMIPMVTQHFQLT